MMKRPWPMFPQMFFLGANAPWTFHPLYNCPQGTEGKDIIRTMNIPILVQKDRLLFLPKNFY
jgi:hypothetical protein